MSTCKHVNRRGYGRCILAEDHVPINNGAGVFYEHEYLPPSTFERRALGTTDVFEALPRIQEPEWIEGCRDVLDMVLAERGKQVARYGLNDDCEDGTGSNVRWLQNTDVNLDLRTGEEIEAAFRAEYERYEKLHGLPTWMHLIREEFAEWAAEDDLEKQRVEAIQTAALLVSWVEATRRRG